MPDWIDDQAFLRRLMQEEYMQDPKKPMTDAQIQTVLRAMNKANKSFWEDKTIKMTDSSGKSATGFAKTGDWVEESRFIDPTTFSDILKKGFKKPLSLEKMVSLIETKTCRYCEYLSTKYCPFDALKAMRERSFNDTACGQFRVINNVAQFKVRKALGNETSKKKKEEPPKELKRSIEF